MKSKRLRWNETKARTALQAWKESGLSGAKYASKHGMNPQRLFWWKKRLELDLEEKPRLGLIPAEVVGMTKMQQNSVVVHAPGGIAVEVDGEVVSPSWVATLVRELRGA